MEKKLFMNFSSYGLGGEIKHMCLAARYGLGERAQKNNISKNKLVNNVTGKFN